MFLIPWYVRFGLDLSLYAVPAILVSCNYSIVKIKPTLDLFSTSRITKNDYKDEEVPQ